jgi:hypothetical protein
MCNSLYYKSSMDPPPHPPPPPPLHTPILDPTQKSVIHSFIHSRVEFFFVATLPRRRKYNVKGLLGAMVCLSHEKDKEYYDGGLGPFTL